MTAQATNLLQTSAGEQWKTIGIKQHHGINLPIFALRSRKSGGIGEFSDLPLLYDWCNDLGLDVIQILPVNDGGKDRSPYSSLSALALNPLLLGLADLPELDKVPGAYEILKTLQELNHLPRINYPVVEDLKNIFLKIYYSYTKESLEATYDFAQFIHDNDSWLEPYTLFKSLKEARNWLSWDEWPQEWLNTDSHTYQSLAKEFAEQSSYHKFVQYLCHKQLHFAKKLAAAKGIFLKGDIPILINQQSADAWRHPNLFLKDFVAGAPPDMYSEEGQKWGFPLYDWDAMEAHHFEWWKKRLEYASQFYHLYRIDHIVGFFRIWAIREDEPAKQGRFIPENNHKWIPQGEKIMKMMLDCCPMLPIAEDLGVVPNEVRRCLKDLGICGTKVMRWERNWDSDQKFIDPKLYCPESMTTVSTHDSDTLRLWWKNSPDEAQVYAQEKGWRYDANISLEQIQSILYESHHSGSLFHINLLQEYLALVPSLVWGNPEDERINVPGIISDNNWSYRFKPYLDEIIYNEKLADAIKSCL